MIDRHPEGPSHTVRACIFVAIALAMMGNYYVYDSIGPLAESLSRQLGFTDLQIGSLNAVYSLPNIVMVLVGGVLVDRYGTRSVMLVTATVCFFGAVVTALGSTFSWMVAGRLLFGLGAETLLVCILVATSRWFFGPHLALFLALNLSLARLGSYLADRSPSFAHDLYERGWQAPLWLAAGFAAMSLAGAIVYWIVDRRSAPVGSAAGTPARDRIEWRRALSFPAAYWSLVGVCASFYAVIFTFRSTFAIKYFQHSRDLTLAEASRMNSVVFLAAMFATPLFGLLVDRLGRQALWLMGGAVMLPLSFLLLGQIGISLWVPTALLGVSFSLVPAVLWPSVARNVTAEQRGAAFGLMTMLQSVGLIIANLAAGYLNDRAGAGAAHVAGYSSMLWFFGLLSLLGSIFALLFRWQDKQRSAASDRVIRGH